MARRHAGTEAHSAGDRHAGFTDGIHTRPHLHMHAHTNTFTVYIPTHINAHKCAHTHVHACTPVRKFVHACTYAPTFVHACIHKHIHSFHTDTYKCTRMRTHMCMHARLYANLCMHAHTRTHLCMHAHMSTHLCMLSVFPFCIVEPVRVHACVVVCSFLNF